MNSTDLKKEWEEVTSYILNIGKQRQKMGRDDVLQMLRELRESGNVHYYKDRIETQNFMIKRRPNENPEGQLEHNGKGDKKVSRAKENLLRLARGDTGSFSF